MKLVRCYSCGRRVPKEATSLQRWQVPYSYYHSGKDYAVRYVRRCFPQCEGGGQR